MRYDFVTVLLTFMDYLEELETLVALTLLRGVDASQAERVLMDVQRITRQARIERDAIEAVALNATRMLRELDGGRQSMLDLCACH